MNVTPRTSEISKRHPAVCVIGLGYIGLPTAAVLAEHGCQVHGVDVRADVVDTVNRGQIHIHEPHLDELVGRVVAQGKLRASVEVVPADVFIICVPTPINENKSPDLSYVEAAAKAVKPHVGAGNMIVLESTSPPCTTEETVVCQAVPDHLQVGREVFVAYCPERVFPGRILIELIENDRIVGGVTPACAENASAFYSTFVQGHVHKTTAINAEITKLAENAFRDVNIAYANELSMLCDGLGGDVCEIVELANRHPRVNILNPGPGVGGHCIGVDPWFLVDAAPWVTRLIRTARSVNDLKPAHVVNQIKAIAEQNHVKTVGCLGLAYKADVDDTRESPSVDIARALQADAAASVLVCDPYVAPESFPEFNFASVESIYAEAELLVLLTDHQQFRDLPAGELRKKLILDTRGTWRDKLGVAQWIPTQWIPDHGESLRKAA